MAGKKRTIYYYSPTWRDKDENLIDIPEDFWTVLWDEIDELPGSSFSFSHYGREYVVEAQSTTSPPVKFIYVGKVRTKDDWPDHRDQQTAQINRLAKSGIGGHLIEGAYLTPSGHENVVAIARTQNGPTVSAVNAAISHHFNTLASGDQFELTPFVRNDQLHRLKKANGATKLHLTLDSETEFSALEGNDSVSRALAEAKSVDSESQMTVGLTLSFGNYTPPESAQKKIQSALINLLGKEAGAQKFSKAEATVVKIDSNGKLRKDTIDFISDRITIKESFHNDEDEQPEPEHILQGMLEANEKFRKKLREN